MSEKTVILKLGGSVITFKDRFMESNFASLSRLAREIHDAGVERLVLVHGGGSFGHPLAFKYRLHEGFEDYRQLEGFSKVHLAMRRLNRIVVESLLTQGLKAVGVQPSSCIVTRSGRIEKFETTPLEKMLELGITPVIYGDIVPDLEKGFSILSGDQIASYLGIHLNVEWIILGTDVDGLYTGDPKRDPKAKLIEKVTLDELREIVDEIEESSTLDVTKGMYGKITELLPAIERGVKVLIVNADEKDRVLRALRREEVLGTIILRS
ncbi:isopentenyl phosphate kinase family protein [Candidatus Bathyarchaeota archaeon]|nr:isopentenyl phosphate kinase family protein [Candidatus Bathyarchaeota archaeon]